MDSKPRVFVASSSESLDVAYALQDNLERDAEVTVWTQGVMRMSRATMANLHDQLAMSDYGVFVLGADDFVESRGDVRPAPRNNVILELGMFAGKLGIERSLIVVPRSITGNDVQLPSDLLGLTTRGFDPARTDGNLQAALGPAANAIRTELRMLGPAQKTQEESLELPDAQTSYAAVGVEGSHQEVFQVRDGELWHCWTEEGRWGTWTSMDLPDRIRVHHVGAGAHGPWVDLFVVGDDRRLFHRWWDPADGWSEWAFWSDAVAGPITLASAHPGHNELWVTRHGRLQNKWLTAGSWSDWHDFSGEDG